MTTLWTILGFGLGSVPFSVLVGRAFGGTDIRQFGDGNPGAANAWRAGSWKIGILAFLLDYFKGAVPVGLAHFHGRVSGWDLLPVAMAPILGHAFSPFLRFRGGKGIAVTFGIWTGLTLGEGPILLGLLLGLMYAVLTVEGWAVGLGMLGLIIHFLHHGAAPVILTLGLGNLLLLLWTHRQDLRRPFRLRPWLVKRLKAKP